MRKMFFRVAALSVVFLCGCSTLTQMASLMTCNYNLAGVANPKIAGIGVTDTKDLANLDAMTALKVTTALLSGSLPLSATVNVGVTNPNATAAAVAGLDWALLFDGVSMLTGETAQAVNVAPNGGKSVIPLTVQVDLARIFAKDNKDDMLKFANGLLHLGESDSRVALKIRPAVSFGGQVYKTPYITLSK